MEPHELPQMFAFEEDYWWYRALRRRIFAALRRAGALSREEGRAPASPPVCLDAGCGTGMLLAALGPRVRPLGLDSCTAALALARRRGPAPLVRATVEHLPLRDASVDVIVSADVLYHREVRDDVAALREAARCLKPGGVLVLNLPALAALRSVHDDAVHTARRYTTAEVREKLARAGLAPIEVRYWNWILLPPIALLRLLRRRPQPYWERPGGERERQAGRGLHSDLVPLPRWVNALLFTVLRLEERLGRPAPLVGLSVLAWARKEAPCQPR